MNGCGELLQTWSGGPWMACRHCHQPPRIPQTVLSERFLGWGGGALLCVDRSDNCFDVLQGARWLETGRSAGGLVQNVRKPSHEWGEPLPIQAASPIGEVGARQLSPPSSASTHVALQEFTAPRRQSRTVGSREASLRGPICNPFGQKIRGVLLVRHVN